MLKMFSNGLCLLLLVTVPAVIYGYKSGAPDTVCDSMEPNHGTTAQTSASPYSIKVSPKSIKAGQQVTVTITGNNANPIKGFFVQGRVGNKAVGSFKAQSGVKLVDCGNVVASGASHSSNEERTSVTLTWTAPPNLQEQLKFRNGGNCENMEDEMKCKGRKMKPLSME
ncbi:hypothetical protein C0J52_08860 [Blattella germanica]|nr:hypothetical protein C0J52_08860 [Blattella germanica]